jgi:8-oxo-dGTP diphosphatase
MPTTAPEKRVHVVVGIIDQTRGHRQRYFFQQRQQGKPCAGYWEFPGGKRERGETAEHALGRELNEELGITVIESLPLTQFGYDYAHANVWLDVYQIKQYTGEIHPREGQVVSWLALDELDDRPLLEATRPILAML